MRIQRIDTYSSRSLCLVRIEDDDGAIGWGQTAPFNADITALVLHRQVAPHVLNVDTTPEEIGDSVLEREYKFPGTYVCRALAGVETALWDLRAKGVQKSVAQLLAERAGTKLRERVAVYGSSMSREITPEQEADRMLGLRDEQGYRAFKLRISSGIGRDADAWPGRTREIIEGVRKRVGTDVALLADANSGYTADKAVEIGRVLEANGYYWFEEPCPYWELSSTARVASELEMSVAGGEQDYDLNQWRRIIDGRVVDIVQPDVGYIGGLSRTLRVADMAHAAGLTCVPHSANRSLLAVFSLHLMAAIPNPAPFMELCIEPDTWTRGIFSPSLEVKDGALDVPQSPGWGVEVDADYLAKLEQQVSR